MSRDTRRDLYTTTILLILAVVLFLYGPMSPFDPPAFVAACLIVLDASLVVALFADRPRKDRS